MSPRHVLHERSNGIIYHVCMSLFFTTSVLCMEVKIGVILPFTGRLPWMIPKTRPAIEYAVETIQKDANVLKTHNISIVFKDSHCSETYGPLAAIDMYVEKSAHVFFGPSCDYSVAPIARFSFKWGIPVISAGALVSAFQNKSKYKLLTRMMGSYAKAGEFFLDLCTTFGWKHVGLLYHSFKTDPNIGKSNCFFTMEAIFLAWKYIHGGEPWHKDFDQTTPVNYRDILVDASNNARIVVLCASPQAVREIMIKAHELNFDNGEYVFFNIDLFSSKNDSERPWYNEDDDAERNNKARIAYEALMTVTLRKPTSPEYKIFSTEVKRRAKEMYENFTYGEEEVNSFVGAFHDAVILYALALNETLAANISITNGTEITKRMWNRTFEGITGTVSIDQNGDRNADYSLLDLNPETDTFEVVANYYGNKKQYEPVEHKTIHWAGGRNSPPPDTPDCGFDGSKCPPDEPFPEYGIVIIVLGSIILIVLVAAFFIYRHKRDKTYEEVAKAFGLPESSVKSRVRNMRVEYTRKNIPEISRGLVHSNEDMSQTQETHVERISFRADLPSPKTSVSNKECESDFALQSGSASDSASMTMLNKPLDRSIRVTTRKDDTLIQAVNNDDCYGQHVASEMREIDDVNIKKIAKGQIDVILAKARRSALGVPTDA